MDEEDDEFGEVFAVAPSAVTQVISTPQSPNPIEEDDEDLYGDNTAVHTTGAPTGTQPAPVVSTLEDDYNVDADEDLYGGDIYAVQPLEPHEDGFLQEGMENMQSTAQAPQLEDSDDDMNVVMASDDDSDGDFNVMLDDPPKTPAPTTSPYADPSQPGSGPRSSSRTWARPGSTPLPSRAALPNPGSESQPQGPPFTESPVMPKLLRGQFDRAEDAGPPHPFPALHAPTDPREAAKKEDKPLPEASWVGPEGPLQGRYNEMGKRKLPGGRGGWKFIPPEEYKEFLALGHGAIFDVEMDNTEEAPWREPGVDISDFFNYGMNETSWKAYAKSVRQARVLILHQGKISTLQVEQTYDKELPPELAAAIAPEAVHASKGFIPVMTSTQRFEDSSNQNVGSDVFEEPTNDNEDVIELGPKPDEAPKTETLEVIAVADVSPLRAMETHESDDNCPIPIMMDEEEEDHVQVFGVDEDDGEDTVRVLGGGEDEDPANQEAEPWNALAPTEDDEWEVPAELHADAGDEEYVVDLTAPRPAPEQDDDPTAVADPPSNATEPKQPKQRKKEKKDKKEKKEKKVSRSRGDGKRSKRDRVQGSISPPAQRGERDELNSESRRGLSRVNLPEDGYREGGYERPEMRHPLGHRMNHPPRGPPTHPTAAEYGPMRGGYGPGWGGQGPGRGGAWGMGAAHARNHPSEPADHRYGREDFQGWGPPHGGPPQPSGRGGARYERAPVRSRLGGRDPDPQKPRNSYIEEAMDGDQGERRMERGSRAPDFNWERSPDRTGSAMSRDGIMAQPRSSKHGHGKHTSPSTAQPSRHGSEVIFERARAPKPSESNRKHEAVSEKQERAVRGYSEDESWGEEEEEEEDDGHWKRRRRSSATRRGGPRHRESEQEDKRKRRR